MNRFCEANGNNKLYLTCIRKVWYSMVDYKIGMGKRLRKQRKLLHLTQEQLAEKLNVSDNAVRKWLTKYNLPVTYKEIKEYRRNYPTMG